MPESTYLTKAQICIHFSWYYREIAKHLSLPPVKLHCSMLAEDGIKAAVKDYEAKKAKLTGKEAAVGSEKAAETCSVSGATNSFMSFILT
ncbi:SufE/NifU domain-containing protein [Dioscorea alata]|uniref:SufE/NifU domain-containing protein n=2 Tax=Dioscorea alata TaxID=55571 RepID=A0ACB7VI84_DIOAL|nr:SufE/NifU domain-containing protein [Dioscorea alata]KAH7673949.1 SufE/NifU domain-containing protein [Dioscorea alata]